MMKSPPRIVWLAGLCSRIWLTGICAGHAGAAAVTPSAATNYIFSAPLYPAHIRGDVMGTPPAYRVPRSEDVDWFEEAYGERAALMNGRMPEPGTSIRAEFGQWGLSETNRFYRWATAVDVTGVTNIVVGYSLITNNATSIYGSNTSRIRLYYESLCSPSSFSFWNPLSYTGGYLDGSVPLSSSPRVAYTPGAAPAFTNAYLNPRTESVHTNGFSTIEMPMTNGSVSVFTNAWESTRHRRGYNVLTNVASARPLDYCHMGTGQFPGYTNTPSSLYANRPGFRPGSFAELYDALRGAVRLADTPSPTNRTEYVMYSRSKYSSENGSSISTSSSTNTDTIAKYSISGWSSYSYSWDADTQEYDLYYGFYVSEHETPQYEAVAPTRFQSVLVTTGGVVRVEIEAAFAVVGFHYYKGHRQGSVTHPTSVRDVDVEKVVVIPLATPSLDLAHKVALARVNLNARNLCSTAASAAGAPSPPGNAAEYEPPQDEIHSWSAECSGLVLIYRLHPTSKFEEW